MRVLVLLVCLMGARAQNIVLFGDSLSDGGLAGEGLTPYLKLVLQTNDVRVSPL